MKKVPYRRAVPWLGLLCVLVVYVISIIQLHPTNFFGLTHDDTIYFSSAKALAGGQGYILPSVPGTPRATLYPALYPWILSWVWRWNPSFPGNVAGAVGVTVALGCAFLTAAFLFFRQLQAFNDVEVLVLTLFCALQSVVRVYSANVLSDIPFAAFAIGVIVLSNLALRRNPGTLSTAGCGILTGLTMLVRVLGVPIAAGVLVAMLLRREWRKATVFGMCAAPFFAALAWRALMIAPSRAPAVFSRCSAVWQGTWMFYTSYVGFWKIVSVHKGVFWPILKQNALMLMLQPGIYFADPRFIRPADLGATFICVLSAIAFAGVYRLTRNTGWQPVHFSLAFYVLPLLFWSYPIAGRCLIPFLPLFAAGTWAEGKRLTIRIRESLSRPQSPMDRWAAALLSLLLIVSATGIGLAQVRNGAVISRESRERGPLLSEKHEAYSWLRANTPIGSRVIAYEDVSLFLFSGRQAFRPLTFSPAALYEPSLVKGDVSCLTASAEALQAEYWVMSDDDFNMEWTDAASAGIAREIQLGASLPELFRSSSGHVRVYGLKDPTGANLLTRQDYVQLPAY